MTSFGLAQCSIVILFLVIVVQASHHQGNWCPYHQKYMPTANVPGVSESNVPSCSTPPVSCTADKIYFRTLDGSCNNLMFPEYGMAGQRYGRLVNPNYGDGINSLPISKENGYPLPDARFLSLALFGDQDIPFYKYNQADLQWGQLVGHDIGQLSLKGAPRDCCKLRGLDKRCAPMILNQYDPIYQNTGKKCLHFSRSLSDYDSLNCTYSGYRYAEKISACTAYLDLSTIYGNSDEDNKILRDLTGGLMKTDCSGGSELFDRNDAEQNPVMMSDKRNDINPFLYALNLIFVREHNRIANCLLNYNPNWSDEMLFQTARKINIAQYQKITYCDWLPRILGVDFVLKHQILLGDCYQGYADNYNQTQNAAALASFSVVAFRYNHHRVPGSLLLGDKYYRLKDHFNSSVTFPMLKNIDNLISGMTMQPQKLGDSNIVDDIRHSFKAKAGNNFGSDLKAMDIQRSRDYGMASYNDYREVCGLQRAINWEDFQPELSLKKIELLKKVYSSPDDVDLNIGGSFEKHANGSAFGPTFQCIIGEQFRRARVGDRFFWQRPDALTGFNPAQLREIMKASYSAIMCNNADKMKYIPQDGYTIPSRSNTLVRCDNLPQMDFSKWAETSTNLYK